MKSVWATPSPRSYQVMLLWRTNVTRRFNLQQRFTIRPSRVIPTPGPPMVRFVRLVSRDKYSTCVQFEMLSCSDCKDVIEQRPSRRGGIETIGRRDSFPPIAPNISSPPKSKRMGRNSNNVNPTEFRNQLSEIELGLDVGRRPTAHKRVDVYRKCI